MRIAPKASGPDSSEAVLREYARLAPQYDRKWSFYIRATTRETIARLPMRPTDALLDVGCGTGALLCQLAESYPQASLAGIDPSPEMIEIARKKMPSSIELKRGWAEQIPFQDEAFDAVVSCNVFHYVRRPLAALQEMARALKPAGRLVITDWCDDYWACRICDWYLRRFNRAHFRVYREKDCMKLLVDSGQKEVRIERYKISWLWGLMTAITKKGPRPNASRKPDHAAPVENPDTS